MKDQEKRLPEGSGDKPTWRTRRKGYMKDQEKRPPGGTGERLPEGS